MSLLTKIIFLGLRDENGISGSVFIIFVELSFVNSYTPGPNESFSLFYIKRSERFTKAI